MKHFFLKVAYLLGQESKCVSKKVGAVIAKDNRIISTGYNGTPKGFINCNQHFPNYNPKIHREEHHQWSKTYEIHAEINCLTFSAKYDIGVEGAELYTILQPCDDCLKAIIAAGIKKIFYVYEYDKLSINNQLWNMIDYEIVNDIDLINWINQQENNKK